MGAWGLGTFENDDAMDWLVELESAEDLSLIDQTLEEITNLTGQYLDVNYCCRALASAEVLAALMDEPDSKNPSEALEWVRARRSSAELQDHIRDRDMAQKAIEAVEMIRTDSELRELWEETEFYAEWLQGTQDLQTRLGK